jgi:hypothetical protein
MDRIQLIERLKFARTTIAPDQEIEVGLFEPGDALGVSLCYFEVYGGEFPIDHVHDPDEVIRRNAGDDQYTIVARTPRGEIVGLAGLFRHAPNPGVYEAGQLMLLKPYRSGRVSSELARQTVKVLPQTLDLGVVFTEAVCNHTVSQRLAHDHGHLPTGLEIECMPATAYAGERSGSRNVSLLLTFDVRKDQRHTVYLPEAHGDAVSTIYNRLGLDRRIGQGSDPAGTTDSDGFLLPQASFARITVQKAGMDFNDVVAKAESSAGPGGLVQMYMNLGDPAAPGAIGQLRENGYFFGGLLPLWFGTDGLILQKLPRSPAWDEVALHDPAARDLAAYIRKDYEGMGSNSR